MFYENQTKSNQKTYKAILKKVGEYSRLFSDSATPYLSYRIQENAFCYSFNMKNAARDDSAVDAVNKELGVGLKTWVGTDDQKIAEFGKLLSQYEELNGIKLAKQIASYRNSRITVSKNLYGVQKLVYHIIKREPHKMHILEHDYDLIDVDKIKLLKNRGRENNLYFTDGKNEYHFSNSKHTLYMLFNKAKELDSFSVAILEDPFKAILSSGTKVNRIINRLIEEDVLCAKIYSENKRNGKFVPEKSGLNQWNGKPRLNTKNGKSTKRNPDELYIPLNGMDNVRAKKFFPPHKQSFNLHLPNGERLKASICQDNSKAVMSNPNKALGKWLLRDVFGLKEGTLVTYDMLLKFGIDSVIFTKIDSQNYRIDFTEIGTYEKFYGLEDEKEEEDE